MTTGTPGQDALQFISHEEGRMRVDVTNANTPNPYDYFIKDHLGNVRMVLTDEYKQNVYPAATLENVTYNGGTAISVESQYYTIDNTKIVNQSVPPNITAYPNNNGNPPYNTINLYSNTTANSARLYQLNSTTNKMGLGIVLKVMTGDQVNIFGKSYYKKPNGQGYTNPVIALTVTEILNAFTGISLINAKGVTTAQISGQAGFPSTVAGLIGTQPGQTSTTPKAAIQWIVFDEQFKYVAGGFDMTGTSGVVKSHNLATIPTINLTKNGYIYVYCANESQYNVFFDNLQLIHTRGSLVSEDHYYMFGERMFNICSEALNFGSAGTQKKKYNGIEKENDLSIELYDAQLRELDGQTGRWWQIDPKTEDMEMWSPYVSNYNNPIRYSDPLGDEGEDCCGGFYLGPFIDPSTAVKIVEKTKDVVYKGMVSAGGLLNGALNTITFGAWPNNPAAAISGLNQMTVEDQQSYNAAVQVGQVAGAFVSPNGFSNPSNSALVLENKWVVPHNLNTLIPIIPTDLLKVNSNSNSSKGQGSGTGRGKANRKPDKEASGDHSVINKKGSTTFRKNDKNPKGWDEVERIDTKGKPHRNSDGTIVPTPHKHTKGEKNVTPLDPKKDPMPKWN